MVVTKIPKNVGWKIAEIIDSLSQKKSDRTLSSLGKTDKSKLLARNHCDTLDRPCYLRQSNLRAYLSNKVSSYVRKQDTNF